MAIVIPAKRTGPKARKSAEECQEGIDQCRAAVGTRQQWGRGSTLRLARECEAFGVECEFVEEKG